MRPIALHDSRSGEVTDLVCREPGKVGIYACGPTVYDRVHVGNARPFVVFSTFKRFLEHEGYEVTFVANVTDVNDKIYAAARERGVASDALAEEMTAHYRSDTDGLGLGRPDHEPLATATMPEIVALIETLVERDHAYEAGGDVFFRVRSLPEYGELSHRDVDQMDQGEGVEGADRKADALDFALWKGAKEGEDTTWASPWGPGRPGWHIECSAMAEKLLGTGFEIHGGGTDLLFPHHENEAAQTLAAHGEALARIWMHNGMLEFARGEDAGRTEKMSKSVGNVVSLGDALAHAGRDTLLMLFAGTRYRQPLPYRDDTLEDARGRVQRFRDAGRRLIGGEASPEDLAPLKERFFAALADDFNTPEALAVLHEWVNEANKREDVGDADLREMLDVLGLGNLLDGPPEAPEELQDIARRREAARKEKDFATADKLRDELLEQGWVVRDGPSGPELVPAGP